MVKIWLISDTHFGHENIIRYCGRPFASAAEMDQVMIERWNATVRPQDHVYHLGDVAMGSTHLHRVLPCLHGHKRLVLGNHDNMAPMKQYVQYFDKILAWRKFDTLILTHVPIHRESFGKATVNVHGHTHQHPAYPGGYINVCVEHTEYAPVALDAVIERAKHVA
jgi:calcineurin-like phosphoesterase family protein